MADDNVIIFVTLKPKPGKEPEFETLLRGMCEPSRAEPGCVSYNLFRTADGSGFHFYEAWKTQADLDAHRQTPHLLNFRARLADLAEGPPAPVFLERIDSKI